jgi:hypothetical protein
VVLGAYAALSRAVPYPFTTGGDVWWYYLPAIRSANARLLFEGRPGIDWALGQGWNPLESGQIGLGYPPYLVSVFVALRVLRNPNMVLEVSAVVHALLGLLVVLLRGRRFPFPIRCALAVAIVLNQSAWIWGGAGHDFLTTLPWAVGLALCTIDVAYDGTTRRRLLELAAYEGLFFWTCHVQMIVVVNVILGLLLLALAPSPRLVVQGVAALAVACVPLMVPLLYFQRMSLIMQMPTRSAHLWMTMYRSSVAPSEALEWLAIGGARGSARIWRSGWLWQSPALLLLFGGAIFAKVGLGKARPIIAATLVAFLLCPAILPEELWFDLIVVRVRWPDKAMTLVGPIAILTFAWVMLNARARLLHPALLAFSIVGAHAMAHAKDSMRFLHPDGARAFIEEGARCFDELGIGRGARMALVDKMTTLLSNSHPLPFIAATGNAPLSFGRASVSVYEPLEPEQFFSAHLGLNAPWLGVVTREQARDERYLEKLRALGVTHLIAEHADALAPFNVRTCVDRNGAATFAAPIGGTVVPFPWGEVNGVRTALAVEPDGSLETTAPSAAPPATPGVARRLTWERLPNGRWRGRARLIDPIWPWSAAGAAGIWLLAVWRWPRFRVRR